MMRRVALPELLFRRRRRAAGDLSGGRHGCPPVRSIRDSSLWDGSPESSSQTDGSGEPPHRDAALLLGFLLDHHRLVTAGGLADFEPRFVDLIFGPALVIQFQLQQLPLE